MLFFIFNYLLHFFVQLNLLVLFYILYKKVDIIWHFYIVYRRLYRSQQSPENTAMVLRFLFPLGLPVFPSERGSIRFSTICHGFIVADLLSHIRFINFSDHSRITSTINRHRILLQAIFVERQKGINGCVQRCLPSRLFGQPNCSSWYPFCLQWTIVL